MAPWDFLWDVTRQAIAIDFITRVIVLVLSLAITVIALLAFKRSKSGKFLFVSIAFILFTVKWALKVVDLFFSPGEFFHRAAEDVFELLILAALFIAIFKK